MAIMIKFGGYVQIHVLMVVFMNMNVVLIRELEGKVVHFAQTHQNNFVNIQLLNLLIQI